MEGAVSVCIDGFFDVQIEDRDTNRREKASVPIPVYRLTYARTERYKYVDAITNQPGR